MKPDRTPGACRGIFAGLVFAAAALPARAQDEVLAADCDPIPGLPRTYYDLRKWVDVNDAGVVAFGDRNGIYTIQITPMGPQFQLIAGRSQVPLS